MKQVYSFFRMTLAAGEYRETAVYGNFLNMLANNSLVNIRLSVDGQPEQEFPKGLSVELPKAGDGKSDIYKMIGFRNADVAQCTIEFSCSNGSVYDSRIIISGSLDVNPTPNTISTPAAVAVAIAAPGAPSVAASAATREVHIQNNGANDIWWGDINVDGANNRGQKIIPGGKEIVTSAAAIYLRSTVGASTASIAVMTKV